MLLLIAFLCLAAAAFAVAEVATYPARLKERSIRRAAEYGRVRIPDKADELLRFRERVLIPAPVRTNSRGWARTNSASAANAGAALSIGARQSGS